MVLGCHMQLQIGMVRCGVTRCILGSFSAFFEGWIRVAKILGSFGAFWGHSVHFLRVFFFHLKWIANAEEFIYLNFLRSPDNLKRSKGSLTLKIFIWPFLTVFSCYKAHLWNTVRMPLDVKT